MIYLPDLKPSDFHQFQPLKDAVHGHHFRLNEEIRAVVRHWLVHQLILREEPEVFMP